MLPVRTSEEPRAVEPPAMRIRALTRSAAVALVVSWTAADAHAADLAVVATVQPAAMLVRAVGGEQIAVTSLVPPGASPHTFEPRPGDVAALAGAALLVAVGDGLDAWTLRLRDAAGRSPPVLQLLDVPGADPLPAAPGETRGDDRRDPHVWLDPIRVRDALAPALAARLAELDPGDRAGYGERLAAFQTRLTALDDEIRHTLAGHGRAYLPFHDAWRYFAARYGLHAVGVVEESPGAEPTPRELAALVAAARHARVPAILVEPQLSPRLARVLADELGIGLVVADPNGDPRDPARARYEDLMRWNARAFARALGSPAP